MANIAPSVSVVMDGAEPSRIAAPKPRIVIAISVANGSPLLPLAQALCVQLNLYDKVSALLLLSTASGGREWFFERIRLMKETSLFIPMVDFSWLSQQENVLEFALALREGLKHDGVPLVLPLIDKNVEELGDWLNTNEEAKSPCQNILQLLTDSYLHAKKTLDLIPVLKQAAFHITVDVNPASASEIAVKVANFLVQVGYSIDFSSSLATGGTKLEKIYLDALIPSGRKANSGVLQAIRDQVRNGPAHCTRLSFARIYIADLGAIAVARFVGMLPSLRTLELCGNGINNNGIMALCHTLSYHPSLTELDLSNNIFSQAGAAELVLLLRRNRRILQCNVENNFIHSNVWENRIKAELSTNQARADSQVTAAGELSKLQSTDLYQVALSAMNLAPEQAVSPLPPLSAVGAVKRPSPVRWNVTLTVGGDLASLDTTTLHVAVCISAMDITVTPWKCDEILKVEYNVTLSLSDSNRHLISCVKTFVEAYVHANFLSYKRINGKNLQFILESPRHGESDTSLPSKGVENLLLMSLKHFSKALETNMGSDIPIVPAAADCLLPQEHIMHVSIVQGAVCTSSKNNNANGAFHMMAAGGGDGATEAPIGAFMVESTLVYVIPTHKSKGFSVTKCCQQILRLPRIGKNLSQLYRTDITRSSGNIKDEIIGLVALMNKMGEDLDHEEEEASAIKSAAQPVSKVPPIALSKKRDESVTAAVKAQNDTIQGAEQTVTKGVVGQFTLFRSKDAK